MNQGFYIISYVILMTTDIFVYGAMTKLQRQLLYHRFLKLWWKIMVKKLSLLPLTEGQVRAESKQYSVFSKSPSGGMLCSEQYQVTCGSTHSVAVGDSGSSCVRGGAGRYGQWVNKPSQYKGRI